MSSKGRNTSNRSALPILVLLLLAVLALAFVAGVMRGKSIAQNTPSSPQKASELKVEVSERGTDPADDWRRFVDSIKKRCTQPGADCFVGFQAMHEYSGKQYGVMVIAWKDSEYEISLYRHDHQTMGWMESPMKQGELINEVDVPAASKKWGVPASILQKWLDEATEFMHKEYGKEGM